MDSIPLGEDFRIHLDVQVAKCEVFLAVIGRDWMQHLGSTGRTRLDDPRDFVRIEIESALQGQISVIPVLVGGASIPSAERLPDSIQDLSYRQGIAVRSDPDFHRDMDRLIEHLKKLSPAVPPLQSPLKDKQPTGTQARIPQDEVLACEAPVDMVTVPKGPFLYGEGGIHEAIAHNYWFDQYPVPNEKYRASILADGYGNQAYWSVEGWKWKTKNNINAPEYWHDRKWNKADHLVVGVSYYDAEAYAKWVGKRLPTERGWEKAARARTGASIPGETSSTRTSVTAERQRLVTRLRSPSILRGAVPTGAMTGQGMSGSGVRTGLTKKRKIGAWSGAAPGVTYRRIFVYPTDSGPTLTAGATTSASVLPWTFRNPVPLVRE